MKKLTCTAFSRAFFIAVLILLILFSVLVSLPAFTDLSAYAVLSGSMEPTVLNGSLIYVKPQSVYFAGDIVTFRSAAKPVKYFTHRIVSVSDGMAVTRGDANLRNDPEQVPLDRAQGKLFYSIPFAGFFVTALDNFWVKLAFALFLLCWLMLKILHSKHQKDKGETSDSPNPIQKEENIRLKALKEKKETLTEEYTAKEEEETRLKALKEKEAALAEEQAAMEKDEALAEEKAAIEKEAARLKAIKEKEAALAEEYTAKEKEKERLKALKEKADALDKEKAAKEKEKERLKALKEKEESLDKEKAAKEKEKARLKAQEEKNKALLKEKTAKERERTRLKIQKSRKKALMKEKAAKEQEKERLKAEKEKLMAKNLTTGRSSAAKRVSAAPPQSKQDIVLGEQNEKAD